MSNKTEHSIKLIAYDAVDLDKLAYANGDVVYDNTNGTLRLMNGMSQGGTYIATRPWATGVLNSAIATEVTNRNNAIGTAIGIEVVNRDSAITTAVGNINGSTAADVPPANPKQGSVWVDTSTEKLYVYQSGAWIQPTFSASGGGGGTNYTLPTASTSVLGGVKIDGTTVTINANGVISSASAYTLPIASASVLGGVKIDGSTIISTNGVISANISGALPAATSSSLGGVIVPAVATSGLNNVQGTITLAAASTTQVGGVIVDGATISINNGVISANYTTYALPIATTGILGGVKVDGTTITISNGVISASASTPAAAAAGSLTGTTLASNVVTSSLTSIGTLANLTVTGTATASSFVSSAVGSPTLSSSTNIFLSAANAVVVSGSVFRLASYTTTARGSLTPQNGDIIYNTTTNKFNGYQNGGWINLDTGTAA